MSSGAAQSSRPPVTEIRSKQNKRYELHNTLKDIYLWRRKSLSMAVLVVATATWVLLELYQFNLVSVASWLAISVLATLFIWGNILRLLGKEAARLPGMEVSEGTAIEVAYSIKECVEEGVRWMFRVSAERPWFVFAGTAAGLWVLSLIGSVSDLLTLLYLGIIEGMTLPVINAKYEYKLSEYWDRVRGQGRRLYNTIDEKLVMGKMKNKVVGETKVE
ncbi:hypothetical protein RJ640_030403 [Escallonia rubra]|uniref:Reticulon-like protein n=1 Tax=Escallonia rubra TaxID=112253 RepID=A0AA88UA33_9ASTE|nr:hypothetical protein RJ640_030403 [Escallonia rubra]